MITLVDVLNRHAAEQPKKIAVHFRDQSLTYAQLRRQAALLGGYLQSLGVTVGDRIMLTGASRPEYLIGLLAVQMVGGITVPVDRNPKPATLSYIHQLTGAKYYLSTLKKAPEGIAILPYGDTIAAAVEHNQEAQVPETDPDRLVVLLQVHRSFHQKKGASHTLRCISANMHNTFTGIGMRKEDVLLLPLPLNHSFGMRVLRACLLAGGTIVLQNGFGFARETELNIEQFHCNALACVPSSMDLMLSQMEDRAARIFGQLRYIEFGAGSLSVQRKRYLSELLPHTELFNTWGSSETGGCLFLHVNRHLDKVSAVGHPLEGIQVRLLSQADGTPLEGTGPDVVGRLALKGQMQMVGYYGLPERTAEALQDGWLVTNDLVWRDDDGFIYMLGRADDIINVGGEKASPVEIENAASECPGVVECASIKVAGDQFNEAVVKYMRRKHNLLVGERTAEQMKMEIGCVFPPEEEMTMEVKGRSLVTGLPELITVSSAEMLEAFEEPVERIMEEVHLVLEKTPPELVADISNNGIVMTGGGSLVRGFDKLVTARTGIHATVAENAIQCVAEGTGKSLESIQDMQDGTMNLSRRKQIN